MLNCFSNILLDFDMSHVEFIFYKLMIRTSKLKPWEFLVAYNSVTKVPQIKTGGMAIITEPLQCSHMPLGTETF